jgi:hypothetical protein
MRSSLAKPTKTKLDEEFRARFPDFKKVPKSGLSSRDLLYRRPGKNSFTAYIHFLLHDSDDTFTADVAGSVKNRFPSVLIWSPAWFEKGEPIYNVKSKAPREEFGFRLADFWTKQDYWWPVTSFQLPAARDHEAVRRYLFDPSVQAGIKADLLDHSVHEVLEKLCTHAIPYLEVVEAAIAKYGTVQRPKGEYPELDEIDGR